MRQKSSIYIKIFLTYEGYPELTFCYKKFLSENFSKKFFSKTTYFSLFHNIVIVNVEAFIIAIQQF